jgi:hypothetical protein
MTGLSISIGICLPDVCGMVKSAYETPSFGPGERLQIQITDVVKHIVVVTRDSPNNEQLILVQNSGMSCSAFGYMSSNSRLSPVSRLEVENDQVGQIGSMLILAAKDKELVSLVQRGCVTWDRTLVDCARANALSSLPILTPGISP